MIEKLIALAILEVKKVMAELADKDETYADVLRISNTDIVTERADKDEEKDDKPKTRVPFGFNPPPKEEPDGDREDTERTED